MNKARARALQIGFVVVIVSILSRVGFVQTHDVALAKEANDQWDTVEPIAPVRGTIYDEDGGMLAYDAPSYTIDIDLSSIHEAKQTDALARGLAKIFGTTVSNISSQLNRPGVVWLQMYPYMVDIPLATKERVTQLLDKLGLANDYSVNKSYTRVYPDGRLASQVIGFTGPKGQGLAGVEFKLNAYLTGKPGVEKFTQDSSGNPIPFQPVQETPPQNGDNVYLTINSAIQIYAEQALATIKKRFDPAHAAIIVANPETGAILAMSVLPNFNPNHYWAFPESTLYTNWAIDEPFEPGSTIKPEVLVGALATHSIKLNQTYMSGVDYVNGVAIHDWNVWGWGRLTYEQALIYSSNTGMIHIGQAEGVKNFYHYLNAFGFTRRTGIDLPGEAHSIIFPQKNLNAVDYATMTFGQGLAVTPISQVAAIGAIANGGHLLTPYVVQKIVTPTGHVVYNHRVKVVRQVASPAIMREVTNVMIKVVNDDPQGDDGSIPGYNIAGKTGTAEIPKPSGGYYSNLYNLSFIGFAPAHHPQLEVYVTVNMPHHTAQWGDWVATPAARYVFLHALKYLRIAPHPVPGVSSSTPLNASPKTAYKTVPNVIGLSLASAQTRLRDDSLRVESIGSASQPVA
ncbi:MAG: penicillin-binding transpeptidase domain-containing protein, partial [Firmicutes bacterium]|nr:penicillin-binding transpeptidase domain-containing protein [Bacillota bacterium]